MSLSEDINNVQTVEINGVVFYKKGSVREIVKIAAVKFTDEHFNKIDELIVGGYHTKAACDTVANNYGFNSESFRQQYYKRHSNTKMKQSGLSK